MGQGQPTRAPHRRTHSCRSSHSQWRIRKYEHAFWRLQDVRQRRRVGRVRIARLLGGQGSDWSRRRLNPAAVTDPIVRLENLGKRFSKDRPAIFEGVDLTVQPGEYLAVMGESGVGKATLLHLLAGLNRTDIARVLLWATHLASLDSHPP